MIENRDKMLEICSTLNVLYVEDDKAARINTTELLENFFDNITVAVDGEDGLEKYIQNDGNFDLVITDINMPNRNGLSMTREIKKINKKTYCLIMTAHNESHLLIDAIGIGVNGFLVKPVSLHTFTNEIEKFTKEIKS